MSSIPTPRGARKIWLSTPSSPGFWKIISRKSLTWRTLMYTEICLSPLVRWTPSGCKTLLSDTTSSLRAKDTSTAHTIVVPGMWLASWWGTILSGWSNSKAVDLITLTGSSKGLIKSGSAPLLILAMSKSLSLSSSRTIPISSRIACS